MHAALRPYDQGRPDAREKTIPIEKAGEVLDSMSDFGTTGVAVNKS